MNSKRRSSIVAGRLVIRRFRRKLLNPDNLIGDKKANLSLAVSLENILLAFTPIAVGFNIFVITTT